MKQYNKYSRSRSKERSMNNYYEIHRNNNTKEKREKYDERIKESDFERKIDDLKEEQRIKEKEWQIERLKFLERENDLLREITKIQNQNYKYNQNTPKNRYFNRYSNLNNARFPKKFGYQYQRRKTYFNRHKDLFNKSYQAFDIYNQSSNLEFKKEGINIHEEINYDKPVSKLDKLISNISDKNKKEIQCFKDKIYLPKKQGVNLVGLLIGPKGIFLKHLEKESGCKIFINGKTIEKRERYISQNDNDQNHVLLTADTQEKIKKGTKLVEDIIYADEEERRKIINDQLKASRQEGFESLKFGINKEDLRSDDHLKSENGFPGKNARYYKVPNDCIDSIRGKKGETLKKLGLETNCKVQIAKAPIPNTKLRYIFIEGSEENYEMAKDLIEQIIGEYVNSKLYLNNLKK